MSYYDWGNTPINSTFAPATNPSTSTLIAELDSTNLNTIRLGGQNYMVTWIIGASTLAVWQLESATSTALNAGRDIIYVQTPNNQSGQYMTKLRLEPGDRLRARMQASITGVATALIQAEPIT